MTKFRELPIGASFDFIDDAAPLSTSFYHRCVKISPRKYRTMRETPTDTPMICNVGTINAKVYHVDFWYGCGLKGGL